MVIVFSQMRMPSINRLIDLMNWKESYRLERLAPRNASLFTALDAGALEQ
jgi:hypothetical protein